MSYRKTRDQVEKAHEDLVVLDNLVVLAERVTTLVRFGCASLSHT